MNNNPVRYNDPTGHWAESSSDPDINCTTNSDYCENGQPIYPLPPTLQGDADLYSLSVSFGVGPWFATWSFDVVVTDSEVGLFSSYGVGPGFGGDKIRGFENLNDVEWTLMSPQVGATLWKCEVFGDSLNESVQNYGGTALQAGGSIGPFGVEYFSSVDPQSGMINREVEGIAAGVGIGYHPAEFHVNYVRAVYEPGLSVAATWLCKSLGSCGGMQ